MNKLTENEILALQTIILDEQLSKNKGLFEKYGIRNSLLDSHTKLMSNLKNNKDIIDNVKNNLDKLLNPNKVDYKIFKETITEEGLVNYVIKLSKLIDSAGEDILHAGLGPSLVTAVNKLADTIDGINSIKIEQEVDISTDGKIILPFKIDEDKSCKLYINGVAYLKGENFKITLDEEGSIIEWFNRFPISLKNDKVIISCNKLI